MDVRISRTAEEYIRDHGGTVFVRAHPHRCCTGPLTLLDTTTTTPPDAAAFEPFDTGEVGVKYLGGSSGLPSELTIELRGRLKRHPVAYWDGCAFKP